MGPFLGILFAVVLHVLFLLFGGLIFGIDNDKKDVHQDVELVSDELQKDKEKEPEEQKVEETVPQDQPPEQAEVLKSLDAAPSTDAPALEAASLSAIEAALGGGGAAGGDFASQMSFASGGRIGGTGKGGAVEEAMDSAFSLAEIDQKPRAVFQAAPMFPAEMRGKKVEGVVTVVFIVDASGKVLNPRVEKSSHPAFEKPALAAVRQWKFEPAVKGGQRVGCKMRVPIRFQPS